MNTIEFTHTRRKEAIVTMGLAFVLSLAMSPIVIYRYNFFYRVAFPVAVLIIIILLKRNVLNIILSRNCRPLIVCLIVFTFFSISAPEQYSRNCLITYMRGLILFICGFVLSKDPKRFSYFVVAICISLLAIAYKMYAGVSIAGMLHSNRVSFVLTAASSMGIDIREIAFKEMATNFMWYISFAGLLLASVFDSNSKWLRFIAAILFLSILFFCVVSMWTTPVLVLVFGFGIIVTFNAKIGKGGISTKKLRKIFVGGLAMAIIIVAVLTLVNQFTSGEAKRKADRLNMIFTRLVLGQGDFSKWNEASSGRFERIPLSINTFIDSPFVGVGEYSGNISGHSAFIDAFAQFGLLGGIPVAIILIFYMKLAVRVSRKESEISWTMAACVSLLIMFFIMSFLNPIFMSANCEAVFFVVAGFVSGRHALYVHSYKNR